MGGDNNAGRDRFDIAGRNLDISFRHPPRRRSMKILRWTFGFMFGFTGLLALAVSWWLMHPTKLYHVPVSAEIYQDKDGVWLASVTRQLPRGDVWLRWGVTVWVRRGEASFVCQEPMGLPVLYKATNSPTQTYALPASLARCLDDAPPISVSWTRQVMVLGWIPTIPAETTISINTDMLSVTNER